MKIILLANAHSYGGGEMSSGAIAQMLQAACHDVTIMPTREVTPDYRELPGIMYAPPFDLASDLACDLLVFYANNEVRFVNERPAAWARLRDARRRAMILNWDIGLADQPWFSELWHGVATLNDGMRARYLAQTGNAIKNSWSHAPPIDPAPFLRVTPNYDALVFVRHSKDNKFSPQTVDMMQFVWARRADAQFIFLGTPPGIINDPRVKCYPVFSREVVDVLARGSVYWYPLPAGFADQGPRVIVEAMYAGLPCMVDDRDGMAERVTRSTGWKCHDAAAWYAALDDVCGDQGAIGVKGRNARERAKQRFNPNDWAQWLLWIAALPDGALGCP